MPTAPDAARPRCAVAARERGDALWGTAAPARRWLLLEHPGPWARLALQSPGIGPRDAAALADLARASSTRVALVRRHGREVLDRRPSHEPRHWRLVDVVRRREVEGTWREDDGLAEPLAALSSWPSDDSPARAATMVCTHGIHDACCAIWGRPVVEALLATDEDVWECSHLGGDRFAASAVLLPEGACYGNLQQTDAADVVAAHRDRAVAAAYLRGLSSLSTPAQAAVAAVLDRHGPAGVDDVRVDDVQPQGVDAWLVVLTGSGPVPTRLAAAVRRTWQDHAQLTCGAVRASQPFRYDVDFLA